MATDFRLIVSCPKNQTRIADLVLTQSHNLINDLERELSEFISESPVDRFNKSEPGSRVEVPPSVVELVERGLRVSALTENAFDLLAKSGVSDPSSVGIAVDSSRQGLIKTGLAHLSFGAIGKGYALDRVRMLLQSEGFEDFLLNAGGSSLVFSGFSSPDMPWRFAWHWGEFDQDGDPVGHEFAHFTGECIGVGTSGFHYQGAHILKERDGSTAQEIMTSALIQHPHATEADALSTAFFIKGWESQFVDAVGAAAIDQDSVPSWNKKFDAMWGGFRIEH